MSGLAGAAWRALGVGGSALVSLWAALACGVANPEDEPEVEVQQSAATLAPKLDPNQIPKFVQQLPRMPVYIPRLTFDSQGRLTRQEFTVEIAKFNSRVLPPPFPTTPLFGYGGLAVNVPDALDKVASLTSSSGAATTAAASSALPIGFMRTSPGPTFLQFRGVPALIHYRNRLEGAHPLPVDPTLDWANPNNFPKPSPPFAPFPPGYPQAQSPIPHVTHTHGIEVDPSFDGTPDTWFTPNNIRGPEYVSNDYIQPSSNESAAFWYHDHVFGMTRLDVGMGLLGFSILKDPNDPLDRLTSPLPKGEFEVPLVIQDRSFRTDGTLFYPTAQTVPPGSVGANPDVNPYWVLMFDGDVNVVNGVAWPNMNVKRALYRFRILNGANQRFYRFRFSNNMPFRVIGSDGGYLTTPKTITEFQLGVTERADILVDFSQLAPGTKIRLLNTEQLQPPIGPAPDPNNDGLVMQFTVQSEQRAVPTIPQNLNTIAQLTPNRPERILIQNVQSDDQDRILQAELDGQLFHTKTTELPTVGATEDWVFLNTTPLTHNKHVHLIQFQVIERQEVRSLDYLDDWIAANGNPPFTHPTLKLDYRPYLVGTPERPFPEESGWKDTVRTPANQITRIRVRWAPTDIPSAPGQNKFPINPVYGIGFIWHCHLVEHEDNEMMRPMTVVPIWARGTSYGVANRNSPGRGAGLVDFNGIDYGARVAHVSNDPPNTRPDLWERINNQNGNWAVQIIYDIGDRVFFGGRVYRALRRHQATNANAPNVAPTFWQLVL